MARAQGCARFRLLVGPARNARLDGGGRDLAEDMGAEGGCNPGRGTMAGALGVPFRFNPAILFGPATILEPLAAVLIAEHEGCGLDAHTGKTARRAPRCVFKD